MKDYHDKLFGDHPSTHRYNIKEIEHFFFLSVRTLRIYSTVFSCNVQAAVLVVFIMSYIPSYKIKYLLITESLYTLSFFIQFPLPPLPCLW